ncbi:MAG: MotA/TolQ/ExbB proton channel family protein [Anaerovoracaceae bacterium]
MTEGLSQALHILGQVLKVPCIIILMLLVVMAIWQIGDICVEYVKERRKRKKVSATKLLSNIKEAKDLKQVIKASGLSLRQVEAILLIIDSKDKSKGNLTILAQQLLSDEEYKFNRVTSITDLIMKLGPLFGLLGTLIPLGPGIVALGKGDTETLSKSMGIAFDTTIAGIIAASIASVISHLRKYWYESYLVTFELVLEEVIEEVSTDA